MSSTLRLAGAAALCAALLLGACAKKSSDQTTTSTDTTAGTSAPAADAMTPVPEASPSTGPSGAAATGAASAGSTSVPDATATSGATMAAMSGSAGNGNANGGGFITLPIYPGASPAEGGGSISSSSNTGSVDIKWYTTKDDSKKVVDWYKANLPPAFQNFVISANGKTTGTFSDEHKDGSGDQSVIITADDATNATRIQLATKHGK